jgi:hypothetical protein
MTNEKDLTEFIEELIDNCKSCGDLNPHPHNIASMIIEGHTEDDGFECTYEEAYNIAYTIRVRQIAQTLCKTYDEDVIAYKAGIMLIELSTKELI